MRGGSPGVLLAGYKHLKGVQTDSERKDQLGFGNYTTDQLGEVINVVWEG